MANVLPSNGRNSIQIFPLLNIVKETGAATIDTTDMNLIMFDTDLTIYIGSATTATFELAKLTPLGVGSIDSMHISAASSYMYV